MQSKKKGKLLALHWFINEKKEMINGKKLIL